MDFKETKMMLDEAIIHARDIAENKYLEGMLCHANPNDEELDGCIECAREHEQLAQWLEELKQYKQIGTLQEVQEAVEKQKEKRPIYKHYEDIGEPPYIKIACPNGCGIQLYPVTDKHLAHEHAYCPKCGQAIDWSEEE